MDKHRAFERLARVFVVEEATVAEEVVDLLGGEVLEGVGCVVGVDDWTVNGSWSTAGTWTNTHQPHHAILPQ